MNVKKLIGTITIALLVVALSVGMAAAGAIDATDSTGTPTQEFFEGEQVYACGYLLTGNPADVYVVVDPAHEVWHDGELIDDEVNHPAVLKVTAYPKEVDQVLDDYNGPKLLGMVGNNANQIPAPGCYDVVYDHNQDGYFNSSVDCVDYMACCGFNTEIPEFATLATPVIALLGLVFFMRRKKD